MEASTGEKAKSATRVAALPVLISIGAGVGTALFKVEIGIGIIAGLLAGAIALLIHLIAQVAGSDVDSKVKLEQLRPVAAVKELDATLGEFLLHLSTAQLKYLKEQSHPTVFDLELGHQQNRILEQYEECSRGTLRLNLRPASLLRETDGVSTVSRQLKATSVVPPGSYWEAPSGLSYIHQQEEMLDRGVTIKRVFIQREAALADLQKIIARHLEWRTKYGADRADVRVALIDEIDSDLIEDFAVVDDATVIRLEIQHGLSQPSAVVWEIAPSRVEQANRVFNKLWEYGRDPVEFPILAPVRV